MAAWRTRAALLDRTEIAAKQAVKDRGLTINVYRVPGGYEAREVALGAPACSNEFLRTFRPDPPPAPPARPSPPAPQTPAAPPPTLPAAAEVSQPAAGPLPPCPQCGDVTGTCGHTISTGPPDGPTPAPHQTQTPAADPPAAPARPAAADKPPRTPAPGPKRVK